MVMRRTYILALAGEYCRYLCLIPSLCICLGLHSVAFARSESLLMPAATESLLLDIARAGNRLVAVGERGHILFSDNNAIDWQQAQVPTRALLTAVHFASDTKGWAVGHDGLILATIDAGGHWVVQRDGLEQQSVINHRRLRTLKSREAELTETLGRAVERDTQQRLHNELEELQLDIEDAEVVTRCLQQAGDQFCFGSRWAIQGF